MPGKFLNEITADKPAKDDLGLFFDKSKNTTAQSSLVDIVAAGLDITSGKAGEAPVVIETVNPDGTKTQSLGWGKTGSSAGSMSPRPANSTDLIITHDPASGTDGAATPAQVLTAGLPAGGVAGNVLTFAPGGVAWGTIPNEVPAFTDADDKKQLTVKGITGRSPILEWNSDSSDLPAYTVLDAGKHLNVKADGKSVEWVAPELPTLTAGLDALQIKADKSGVEWTSSVNMSTNLKGGFTAGAFFPVNDQKANTTRFVDAPAFRKLAGVPELVYFPNWTPVNEQIGAGWNDMGVALARMAAIAKADTFAGTGQTATGTAGAFPGGHAYYSAVVLPNGKVVCAPRGTPKVAIYDPVSGTVTKSAADVPGYTASWANYGSCVLLKDGKVLLIPVDIGKVTVYDPATDAFTTATTDVPGAAYSSSLYQGSVLLPNGKVLLVPSKAAAARIYDPVANTITANSHVFPGGASGAYDGGVLLPDGKVFLVPSAATKAKIYDPVADTFTDCAPTFPGGGSYSGGVLLPNGKVFLVPYAATKAKIYDPLTDTATDCAPTFPGGSAYRFGLLLPNGRVFLNPFQATQELSYDPLTDTIHPGSATLPGSRAYVGAVLLHSGKVFLVPAVATQSMTLDFSSPQVGQLSNNFVTSPFFNKT